MAKYKTDVNKKSILMKIPKDLYENMIESIKIRAIIMPDISLPENVTQYMKNVLVEDYERNRKFINSIKRTEEDKSFI